MTVNEITAVSLTGAEFVSGHGTRWDSSGLYASSAESPPETDAAPNAPN